VCGTLRKSASRRKAILRRSMTFVSEMSHYVADMDLSVQIGALFEIRRAIA
jgi:hypothetical protein